LVGVTAHDQPETTQRPFLNAEPSANYRTTQPRFRERKSVDHTIRHGIRSMIRSVARRPDFDIPDLAALDALRAELDVAITVAAGNLRNQGHSWQQIADGLGISRQAAHKRFWTDPDRRWQRSLDSLL
jgi:hypothetical protein